VVVFFVSVTVALVISFFCSLMEAALLSLTPSQIAAISEKHPRTGKIWQRFKSNIEKPIAVILILNTSAHTIGATLAGAQFDSAFGTQYIWLFSLVFTFLMLQYTEILPKTLGVQYNQRLALVIARPLDVVIRILSPFIYLLHLFNRPFEGKADSSTKVTTLDEIRSLAAMARNAQSLGVVQEKIITETTNLAQRKASDLMIQEAHISMLHSSMSLRDAFVAAHVDAHTRYPVSKEGDREQVMGYVNFKELVYFMSTNPNQPDFQGIVRPVLHVKRDTPALELMKSFIGQHEHVAIVCDDANRCVGMITLEDLIEELVGDLQDEFDRLPHHMHTLGGGTLMIGGGVAIESVVKPLDLSSPVKGGTLAAWLASELGDNVRPGATVTKDGVLFTVKRIRRGRVFEVSAYRPKASGTPGTPPA